MLGTLVALAVEKMVNLESFVWDMPTGVLSEIFMALASIPEQSSEGESKLEKVWVRWHDNTDGSSPSPSSSPPPPIPPLVPPGSHLTTVGILIPSDSAHPAPRGAIPYAETNIEFPTFSVLPPLKSLTVLDIDELAYLDEMAVAIERSKDCLQELRVGISPRAVFKDFVQAWDGPDLQQIDRDARWPGESSIGERRLGGVLGVLVGRIYDIRRKSTSKSREKAPMASTQATQTNTAHSAMDTTETSNVSGQPNPNEPDTMEVDGSVEPLVTQPTGAATDDRAGHEEKSQSVKDQATGDGDLVDTPSGVPRRRLDGKLKLRSLELERVHLSIQVFSQAFDWTVLTTLTILECTQHDTLWKALRKQFAPTPIVRLGSHQHHASSKQAMEYHLNLKSIHTDVTSVALISFLRDTLAPNSLEVLFLQDRRRPSGPPAVTIDQIFKGVIKKHRASLQKVLLDSSDRKRSNGNTATDTARWRNWVLPTDMLLYMTSGRMVSLRELAISLHFKDWVSCFSFIPCAHTSKLVNTCASYHGFIQQQLQLSRSS